MLELCALPVELELRLAELLLALLQLLYGQLMGGLAIAGALADLGGPVRVADVLEIGHEALPRRMMAPKGGTTARSLFEVSCEKVLDRIHDVVGQPFRLIAREGRAHALCSGALDDLGVVAQAEGVHHRDVPCGAFNIGKGEGENAQSS